MVQKCRICGGETSQTGLLYRCLLDSCKGVHWDKSAIKKLNLKKSKDSAEEILKEAGVPEYLKSTKSHNVYVLRLRGKRNYVYVGMTGLHPYERYLNHIRGYQSSRIAKAKATALITFEGPMDHKKAKIREPELAQELKNSGHTVDGGH